MNAMPAHQASGSPIARFRRDLGRRYLAANSAADERTAAEYGEHRRRLEHRLDKLPTEVGALLLIVGTAGVLLPGLVGSPFLAAGAVALWPSAFRKTEDWMAAVSPQLFEEGIRQIERFLADLEHRYPGSTR